MNRRIFASSAALLATAWLVAVPRQNSAPTTAESYVYWDDRDRKYEYAFVDGKGSVHSFGTWATQDLRSLGGLSGDRLYVRKKDDGTYAISDKATVETARKALAPVMELGRQQGELGRKQGLLGNEQGKLGQKMGLLGREMGKLSQSLGEIMRDSWKEEKKAESQKRREEYDRKMGDLHKQMESLSKEQQALGGKQGELGKQQGVLGKRQGEAFQKADAVIVKLIDEAFDKGLAKPVKNSK